MATRRDSMIFYASWYDAIRELPDAVQKEVLYATIAYGIYGEMPTNLGQTAKALMALITPQIEANNTKYENGCKGGEYGVLGGRPRKPQENPKETPNVNVYVNVNENVNDNESESDAHPHALTPEEEKFYQFTEWCRVYATDSLRFTEPLTLEGFWWLYRKYGADKLKQCASDLHNKSAYKRNKNALNCWKKWIEKL